MFSTRYSAEFRKFSDNFAIFNCFIYFFIYIKRSIINKANAKHKQIKHMLSWFQFSWYLGYQEILRNKDLSKNVDSIFLHKPTYDKNTKKHKLLQPYIKCILKRTNTCEIPCRSSSIRPKTDMVYLHGYTRISLIRRKWIFMFKMFRIHQNKRFVYLFRRLRGEMLKFAFIKSRGVFFFSNLQLNEI